jgi:hypothetical protein
VGILSFSQFLIIWAGNLPENSLVSDAPQGRWQFVGLLLVVGHFALALRAALLPSREPESGTSACCAAIAMFILWMRFIDLYWLIIHFSHESFRCQLPGFFTIPVGLVGFGWVLPDPTREAPADAENAPHLEEYWNMDEIRHPRLPTPATRRRMSTSGRSASSALLW